jgi:hypothetical protein
MNLPIILFFIFLALGQVALMVYLFRLDEKASEMMTRLPKQNFGLLHNAYRRAQEIISQAELSGLRVRAQNKQVTRKLSQGLVTQVDESEKKIEKAFLEASGRADAHFLNYIDKLQTESHKQEEALLSAAQRRLDHFLAKFEDKVAADTDTELAEIRKTLETYKTTRMAALDENILAIVERTVGLVLAKKLTIADQTDLVYEALEKAKQEKIIA